MKNVTSVPAVPTKAPNYSADQVTRMVELAPLDLVIAKELAIEFGKNYRSVIAKAKREGIAYNSLQPSEPKAKGPTKRDMVKDIEAALNLELIGLEKAPVLTISNLLAYATSQ